MKINIFSTIFILLVFDIVSGVHEKTKNRPKLLINGRPAGGLVPKYKFKSSNLDNGPSNDQYVTQRVDNFDPSNRNTFQQRYWYNNQWWNPNTNNAVFLMLEGDAPGDRNTLAGGYLMNELAKMYGALQFTLEHRYYGASNVTTDLTTSNLKYLSSRQALADVAHFIQQINVKFNLSEPKWIVFGGSYAGALAAWSDQLYPDLILGVVASSAMMQAVADNSGYLQVVEQVLSSSSPDCGIPLKDGLELISEMLTTATGRQQLFKGFQLCQPLNPNDPNQLGYFYSAILDPYMKTVTYGEYNELCNALTNSSGTPLTNMYNVNRKFNNYTSCMNINYNNLIQYLQNTDLDNADRAWLYQECSEFGFYQSTDGSDSFYGNVLPIDWYIKQCADVFGIMFDNATVYKNVAKTNSYYGGKSDYHGSYALFPGGTADPWHVLGVSNGAHNIYPQIANGTWHCADMGKINQTDPNQLGALKYYIQEMVMWLLMPDY